MTSPSARSRLFGDGVHVEVGERVKAFLNTRQDVLAEESASPRAVGEAVQYLLAEHFGDIVGPPFITDSQVFSRRAMADLAFSDEDGNYYLVDVKTRRTDAAFHMPNLTSIERLARLYEDDRNFFVLLLVRYSVDEHRRFLAEDVVLCPIEWARWDCLSIGALGWGQVQLARPLSLDESLTRAEWMVRLADAALAFYTAEVAKIEKRSRRFEEVRQRWADEDAAARGEQCD